MEYFILGMLIVQVGFPLLDGVLGVLLTGLEALKGYFGLKVALINARIRKIAESEDEPPRRRIGFTTQQEDDSDE